MFDDIGLGKFLANSIITMAILGMLIINLILIYIKEKYAKLTLVSTILNTISAVYFGGYAKKSIVDLNLFYWPLANMVFILWLSANNIILYRRNKELYRASRQQSTAWRVVLKGGLIALVAWLILVVLEFARVVLMIINIF